MHTLHVAVFTTHPENITEIIGKNVTFTCAVVDDYLIDWIVQIPAISKSFDTSSLAMVTELYARGFTLGELMETHRNFEYKINLTVPAVQEHNNTKVLCRSFGLDVSFSYQASLKILGESCTCRASL